MEVGTKEWLETRRKYITASDAPIIMGASPWVDEEELIRRKIKGYEAPQNIWMKRGIDLEPVARECFEIVFEVKVQPEFRICDRFDFPMAASFDGINGDGIVVEIKCPGKKDHKTALEGIVPFKYTWQLVHQAIVANVSQVIYFSYRPEDIDPYTSIIYVVDQRQKDELIKKEREFYKKLQDRKELIIAV